MLVMKYINLTYGKGLILLRIYIIQKGDTLYKVAKKHDVQIEDIIRLNTHISDPEYIVPGMKIKLPNKKSHDQHKDKHKKKKEHENIARSDERPLGSVERINDRGITEREKRIPLKHTKHLSWKSKENKQPKLTKQQVKQPEIESHNQYKSSNHSSHRSIREHYPTTYRSPEQSYTSPKQRIRHRDVQPSLQTAPVYPRQPVYCPCCMYHWHMYQSQWHSEYINEQKRNDKEKYME